jgi:hypothetical protein
METQAAEHRPRQPVAPRPVAGKFAEHDKQRQATERRGVVRQIKRERCQGDGDINRNKNRDREQKADQKLGGEPVIFERLAGDLRIGPEKAAHIGHQPEPIDAERGEQQSRPLDPQLPIGPFRKRTKPGSGGGPAGSGGGGDPGSGGGSRAIASVMKFGHAFGPQRHYIRDAISSSRAALGIMA